MPEPLILDGIDPEAEGIAVLLSMRAETGDFRGDDLTIAGRDGVVWREHAIGAAQYSVEWLVRGADADGLVPADGTARRVLYDANLDALLALLSVRHRPMAATRPMADGTTRYAQVRLSSAISPASLSSRVARVSVDLTVLDGTWRDQDVRFDRWAPAVAATTRELPAFAGMTAPTRDLVVTVTGPTTSGLVVLDGATGRGFTLAQDVPAGQQAVVDVAAWSATINGVDATAGLTWTGHAFLELTQPQRLDVGPSVTVTAPGATAATRIEVRGYRRFAL